MDDGQIITQLKKRDRNALKGIYMEYRTAFFKFASRYNAGAHLLEDIFQDALIVVYENAQKGKLDHLKGSLKTYLFSTGKFMLFKHFRDNKKEVFTDEASLFDQQDQSTMEEVRQTDDMSTRQKMLILSFKKLGDKCREILELFYLNGLSLDEITMVQGYDNKNVAKSQKSRCLKTLKELIRKKDG